MKTARIWLVRVASWVALLAILVGLAGQLGRFFVQADAINILAPFWLGAGGIAAAILLIVARNPVRRWWGLGAALLLIGIALALFRPDPQPRAAADCPGTDLRLVQFNILKDNPDVRAAAAWIVRTGPDIVTLEEAARELPIVALLKADYPYAVACAPAMHCSTMILSRRPFLASGGLAKGDPENRKALSAAWATLPSAAGPFTIVAAHLDRPWPWHSNPQDRIQLVRFVRAHGDGATLLAGDFNLPAGTFQLRQLTRALGIARAPDVRSWPAMALAPPVFAIDHVFSGSRWTVQRVERGPDLGSDHYPLLAHLHLASACGIVRKARGA